MPQTILTPQIYTNELLRRFQNNLGFTNTIRHEYDDRFAKKGAKIGDTLNLRVPVRFGTTLGPALSVQDVVETAVPLVIDTQRHTDFMFLSADLTLKVDRFGDRYLDSAAVALANAVDVDGLTMAYRKTANSVGTPGTIPVALKTYLQAGAKLDKGGCPVDGKRTVVVSPDMQVEIVDSLKGLFQSSEQIKQQYLKGRMGIAAGVDWVMDQNVRTHTVGPLGGVPLVDGAPQVGGSILTKSWTAAAASRVKAGDVFTFAGVFAVNPVSGDTLADLLQMTVTADQSSTAGGALTIVFTPPIVITGPTKNASAAPADGAAVTVLGAASTLTPQGILYHREAFAIACVALERPMGVHMSAVATDTETGISLRTVSQYDINTDKFLTRVDIMYGWAVPIPQFACRIAS